MRCSTPRGTAAHGRSCEANLCHLFSHVTSIKNNFSMLHAPRQTYQCSVTRERTPAAVRGGHVLRYTLILA